MLAMLLTTKYADASFRDGTHAVMVFTDVFKRADQRAGDLVEVTDQNRSCGVSCERAYYVISERP
ncbi:hypothetical protein D3C81_2168110 [compost metagenome]